MGDAVSTQQRLRAIVGTLALVAIVFQATGVVVREGEAVLVTRFGRPLRAATQPGLHWKLPWPIDQASLLDMRRRVYETGHTEMLTRDKKNIIARTFVVWRIGDALAFTQAIGTEGGAETQARRPAHECRDRNAGRARPLGAGVHQPGRFAGGSDRVRAADVHGARGASQLRRGDRADSPRADCAARRERDRRVRSDARRAASIRGQVRGGREPGSQPHPIGSRARSPPASARRAPRKRHASAASRRPRSPRFTRTPTA